MESSRYKYLIALGSSIAPRETYIHDAISLIQQNLGLVYRRASLIETQPEGGVAQEMFLNTAILLASDEKPVEVLHKLLVIEKELGRQRTLHWGDRTIDCDIILAQDKESAVVINQPELTIPHPRCHERLFVLKPAEEIAGDWQHPLQHKTMAQLYRAIV